MATENMSMLEHLSTVLKKTADDLYSDSNNATIQVVALSTTEDYPQFKFKIKITHEGRDDHNLFAKVTELGHNNWDDIILKPFVKERLFYTELLKIYRELEEKHGVSEDDRVKLPACYAAEAAHQREILLLEDLASRGLGTANRMESVCWPYAAAAVTELAKLHALSIAFRHEHPDDFEKFTTQIPAGTFENNHETIELLEGFKSIALDVVRSENKRKLKAFFKSMNFIESYHNLMRPLNCKVIVHAHFWPKNMMHRVLHDGKVEVVPIDFQGIQVGSPVTDLFHFIFTAADEPFRSSHYGELVEHYTLELMAALARLGLDIEQEYPAHTDTLTIEMNEKLSFGLLSAVAYLPVLALDDRADRGRGSKDQSFAAAEMLSRRLNQVVDAYVDSGILDDLHLQNASRKRCGMCLVC